MEQLFTLAFFIGISFVIAQFLGKKRQIGFGWSFFFCFFLTPIIGFFATILSKKGDAPNTEPSKFQKILGWSIIVLFSLSTITQVSQLFEGKDDTKSLGGLFMSIGIIGIGFYQLELGKDKNLSPSAMSKTDNDKSHYDNAS